MGLGNMPLVSHASFKQGVEVLLMPKIDKVPKSTKLRNPGIVWDTRQPLLIITKFNTW